MTQEKRHALLAALLVLVLGLCAIWSYGRYADAASRAARAAGDAAETADLASRIHALRQRPTLEGESELDDAQISSLLYTAAEAASVSPGQAVRSIRSLPPRRAGRSGEARLYRQMSSEVKLEGLTLQQFLTLCHTLVTRNPGLRVASVYITAPQGEGAEARWTFDPVVFSYLVYDPAAADGSER